jgi:hypothetical protein
MPNILTPDVSARPAPSPTAGNRQTVGEPPLFLGRHVAHASLFPIIEPTQKSVGNHVDQFKEVIFVHQT